MEEHAWGVEATKPRPVDGCDGVLAGVIVGSSGNTPSYNLLPSVEGCTQYQPIYEVCVAPTVSRPCVVLLAERQPVCPVHPWIHPYIQE